MTQQATQIRVIEDTQVGGWYARVTLTSPESERDVPLDDIDMDDDQAVRDEVATDILVPHVPADCPVIR